MLLLKIYIDCQFISNNNQSRHSYPITVMNCCKRITNKFTYLILPFVIGIATSGLVFQMLYFLPGLAQSTKIFLQTSAITTYTMCFISYYFAIKIKNTLPSSLIMPRLKSQLKYNHHIYTDRKQCQKQNQRYKPLRTSHCHVCKCVVRMDHHCPYTDNCVGGRNLKAFVLFCGYGALFAIQFLVLCVDFYFRLANGSVAKLSEGEIVVWMILGFFSFLLSISMSSLAIGNVYMAGKNVTQLEMMKGQYFMNDKHGTHPNPYDIGFLSNINSVFGGDYWLFWLPTQIKSLNDFTQYPTRPPITQPQLKQLPQPVQKDLMDPFIRTLPKTIQQLRKQQQNKYQGVIFFYLGKPYQLTKQQIKQKLAEINQIDLKEIQNQIVKDSISKIRNGKNSGENGGEGQGQSKVEEHTEQDAEILADIYND